jgi:hypothetical protein
VSLLGDEWAKVTELPDLTVGPGASNRSAPPPSPLADRAIKPPSRREQEFADAELASRALIASGPLCPAVQAVREAAAGERVEELVQPLVSAATGMVRVSNEWAWIIARGWNHSPITSMSGAVRCWW